MSMLFEDDYGPLEVWRKQSGATSFSDAKWVYIATISGRTEPVVGSEEFLNNQDFHKVSEVAYIDPDYIGIVRPNDGIIDEFKRQFRCVGEPENWRYLLPHVILKLETAQFQVGI